MQKIICLYQRNYETNRLVRDEVTPGAEWVLNGEGVATRKFDGMCCAIIDGVFYKRYELKSGKVRPVGFIIAQEPDPITGDQSGWMPIALLEPEDKYFVEAFGFSASFRTRAILPDDTYECCGPKINKNPEGYKYHCLIPHGKWTIENVPRNFNGLKNYLATANIEGIVWHHPDGRKVKIKARDFGIHRIKIYPI